MLQQTHTKLPTFVNMLLSTDMMAVYGQDQQDSHYTTINMSLHKRMVQRRRLMLTNSSAHLRPLEETEDHVKQVSEWQTRSTCLFNTIPLLRVFILEEKVVVAHALPELRLPLLLESGTKLLRCPMVNCKTLETAMRMLKRLLTT